MTIHGYSTAMKHWDNTAYAAAMNYLVKNPEYKDSKAYIEKFENDVHSSLMHFPWWAEGYFLLKPFPQLRINYYLLQPLGMK